MRDRIPPLALKFVKRVKMLAVVGVTLSIRKSDDSLLSVFSMCIRLSLTDSWTQIEIASFLFAEHGSHHFHIIFASGASRESWLLAGVLSPRSARATFSCTGAWASGALL